MTQNHDTAKPDIAKPDIAASLRARLARGVGWTTAGAAVSQGLTLLAGVLLARALGKIPYGELGAVQTNIALFTVLAGPTLGVTTSKFVAQFRESNPGKAANILHHTTRQGLVIALLAAILTLLTAPLVASGALRQPQLTPVIELSALALFFTALEGVQRGALNGFEAFRQIAALNLVKGVLSVPALLAGAAIAGLPGVVVAIALVSALTCLLQAQAVRKQAQTHSLPPRSPLDPEDRAAVARIYWPTLAGALVQLPLAWILSLVLVRQADGLAQMAIYNAANNWRLAVLFLPTLLNTAFFPLLSHTLATGDQKAFRKLAGLNIALSAAAALLPAILLALVANPVMQAHGHGFEAGTPVLQTLALAAVLAAASAPVGNLFIILDKAWTGAAFNLNHAVVTFAAAAHFDDQGAQGIANAWLAGYTVHAILSLLILLAPHKNLSVMQKPSTYNPPPNKPSPPDNP